MEYGWHPSNLPPHCVCSKQFTIEHALNCSRGGYPTICHNELCNITTTDLLSEVCHNVGIEPVLQPVIGEQLSLRTANREDGARLDIAAGSFWENDIYRQRAFLDVRVFNPFAQNHYNISLS